MRFLLAAIALAALAACERAPASTAVASEGARVGGHYNAASNTARGVTGDVSIERGGLLFASGIVLFTRTLDPRSGADVISSDGDSFAAAALGPGDLDIELRRVTEQTVPPGRVGLCGGADVAYVALAYDQHTHAMTLLAFTGVEAPGPRATQSRVCASFGYAAPDGARTREGVVL
ncbi:MAG: hypothetical protein H7124_11735 [Phycisphaerales bacterium]|nr:hypothetical protein [Hyphomonadaceae bacterium]